MKVLFFLGATVAAVAGSSCTYGAPVEGYFSVTEAPGMLFEDEVSKAVLAKSVVKLNVFRVGTEYKATYSVKKDASEPNTLGISLNNNTLELKEVKPTFSGASRTPATVLPCLFLPAVLPESLFLPGLASCLLVANVANGADATCTLKYSVEVNLTVPLSDRTKIDVSDSVTANGADAAPTNSPSTPNPTASPTTTTKAPVSNNPTTTTSAPTTMAPTTTTIAPTAVPTTKAPVTVAPTTTTTAPTTAAPTTTTSSPTTTTSSPTPGCQKSGNAAVVAGDSVTVTNGPCDCNGAACSSGQTCTFDTPACA